MLFLDNYKLVLFLRFYYIVFSYLLLISVNRIVYGRDCMSYDVN